MTKRSRKEPQISFKIQLFSKEIIFFTKKFEKLKSIAKSYKCIYLWLFAVFIY